jgi:hypothetical protein
LTIAADDVLIISVSDGSAAAAHQARSGSNAARHVLIKLASLRWLRRPTQFRIPQREHHSSMGIGGILLKDPPYDYEAVQA